jgi:hypothetical protein
VETGRARVGLIVGAAFESRARPASGVSTLTKFDSEFAGSSESYSGTGTLRYTW